MLNHTMATGVAISRLLDDVDVAEGGDFAQEIAEYAELARVRLHLDNSAVTAAMMFAQPLVEMWKPQWKFAYTIGLSLGAKFTTEGFFIVDIIDHLTDEFSMEALKEGERIAVASYDWVAMNQRLRVFRNALVSVALEQPLAPSGMLPILMQPEDPAMHVLIVDDSKTVCELHRGLLEQLRPNVRIHSCRSVEAARAYLRRCTERSEYITLCLLDLNLALPEVDDKMAFPLIEDILSLPNGLTVSSEIDVMDDPAVSPPPRDFRFKPLIALITSHAEQLAQLTPLAADGSIQGCDVLLPKPMTLGMMRVLVEGSQL